jgi:putative redox protein
MRMTVDSPGGDVHVAKVRSHTITVDQPEDGGGADSAPTPVELFAASLATCVAHYASRALRAPGAHVDCEWEMSTAPPWRITAVRMDITLPPTTSPARAAAVERAVAHCTVHNTLVQAPTVATTTRIATSVAA